MADDDLERYFDTLSGAAGTPALSAAEADAVLDLARIVAHTSQRRFAPLSAYVAGRALQAPLPESQRVERIRTLARAAQRIAAGDKAGDAAGDKAGDAAGDTAGDTATARG